MTAQRLETDLDGRRLRFDGVSIVSPEQVAHFLLLGVQPGQLRVDGESWEIASFNAQVEKSDLLRPPGDAVNLDFSWKIPGEYLELDVYQVVGAAYDRLAASRQEELTDEERDAALARIADELVEFERRGLINFLRAIIYVLDVFRENGVVWGVGRGSSCASYVLFLLGLHCVDPLRFGVPMDEFFHD